MAFVKFPLVCVRVLKLAVQITCIAVVLFTQQALAQQRIIQQGTKGPASITRSIGDIFFDYPQGEEVIYGPARGGCATAVLSPGFALTTNACAGPFMRKAERVWLVLGDNNGRIELALVPKPVLIDVKLDVVLFAIVSGEEKSAMPLALQAAASAKKDKLVAVEVGSESTIIGPNKRSDFNAHRITSCSPDEEDGTHARGIFVDCTHDVGSGFSSAFDAPRSFNFGWPIQSYDYAYQRVKIRRPFFILSNDNRTLVGLASTNDPPSRHVRLITVDRLFEREPLKTAIAYDPSYKSLAPDPRKVGIDCARRVGVDAKLFAKCAGQRVVARQSEVTLVGCAAQKNLTRESYLNCIAGESFEKNIAGRRMVEKCVQGAKDDHGFLRCVSGDGLPKAEKAAFDCALKANKNDRQAFFACTIQGVLGRKLSGDQRKAIACAETSNSQKSFLACVGKKAISKEASAMLACAAGAKKGETRKYLQCVGKGLAGAKLSDDQRNAINCAADSTDGKAFLVCLGKDKLSTEQKAVLDCAIAGARDEFILCAGQKLAGIPLNREQRAALECASHANADATAFAACAGSKLIDLGLNPEQQIALSCVMETGGQPYAAAACTATKLTFRELGKCFSDGFGGKDGCFGDNNELVGKNGWTAKTLGNAAKDITHGPGPSNDIFGGQGWTGQRLEDLRKFAEDNNLSFSPLPKIPGLDLPDPKEAVEEFLGIKL